jgi:hypothetical protein
MKTDITLQCLPIHGKPIVQSVGLFDAHSIVSRLADTAKVFGPAVHALPMFGMYLAFFKSGEYNDCHDLQVRKTSLESAALQSLQKEETTMTCTYCNAPAVAQLVGTGLGKGSRPNEQDKVFLAACLVHKTEIGEVSNARWHQIAEEAQS